MSTASKNSFSSRATLRVGNDSFEIYRLDALAKAEHRQRGAPAIFAEGAARKSAAPRGWPLRPHGRHSRPRRLGPFERRSEKEVSFMPARVLLQDFTGVPAVVDLAAMRDAIRKLGGDPKKINPLLPAELVIDHSVQVDKFGSANAFAFNADLEMQRNIERYAFLRWGQKALQNFKVVPPDTGICHQVNLEYLARVVFSAEQDGKRFAFPDSLVGTDSHTTMVNGLGVMGWGVGGIEAEAAMLGQPLSMLIPAVVGFKLHGRLPEGATATDLVLTVTQMLRKKGVVGKFVEFYGTGLSSLTLPDRATIANMAPEYGATMGFFPVDAEVLNYLRFTDRSEAQVKLVEAYTKEQGIFRTDRHARSRFSPTSSNSISRNRRPHDGRPQAPAGQRAAHASESRPSKSRSPKRPSTRRCRTTAIHSSSPTAPS